MEEYKEEINEEPFMDIIESTVEDIEKLRHYSKQQDRTIKMKRAILQMKRRNPLAHVNKLCEVVGIKSTKTFYLWLRDDVYFRAAYEALNDLWYDSAMDILKILIFRKEHGPSIRYFLSNLDPSYMTRTMLKHHIGEYLKELKRENPIKLFDDPIV